MPDKRLPDAQELGRYFALAQVGLEMVTTVAIGWLVDYWFGWQPWGIITGAVLGLVIGITHLALLNNQSRKEKPPKKDLE